MLIKLLVKWVKIGIRMFLYLMYKMQFAIANIIAPITASSIWRMPKINEETSIEITVLKYLDILLKNIARNKSSSTKGALIVTNKKYKINLERVVTLLLSLLSIMFKLSGLIK